MVFYTTVSKKHKCPMWNVDVYITAKYRFMDKENPHKAKYNGCSCPIIENLQKPLQEQNKEYSLFRFCKMQKECISSIKFEPEIDESM